MTPTPVQQPEDRALEVARHLAEALGAHRQRCVRDGRSVPRELVAFERIATFRVTLRQAATDWEDPAPAADPVPMTPPRLLTKRDTGAALGGVSERTVERLIADGHLPPVHIGGRTFIRVADLDSYVAALRPAGAMP